MRILKYKHPIIYSFLAKIAKRLHNIERKIYETLLLCNDCGVDCGFQSSVSKYGFLCDKCFKKHKDNENEVL